MVNIKLIGPDQYEYTILLPALGAAVPATADRICVLNSKSEGRQQPLYQIHPTSVYRKRKKSPLSSVIYPNSITSVIHTRGANIPNMVDILSPALAFASHDLYNPQATISLSDTSLQNSLMTPEPTSPESSYNLKEESVDDDESRKPTKKRKSWGQELPTPKTNLPPR